MNSRAVVADAVALLLRRLGGHVHPAVDAHRPARHREALRVVARRRAHHAGGDLLVGQLHQQVVGAAQLVRADRLQVLALQVDRRAGGLRQPLAELQRGAARPRRKFAERPHRCRPRTAAATCGGSGSGQRTPINGAMRSFTSGFQFTGVSTNTGICRSVFVLVVGVVGPRRHRALPPGGLLVAEHLAGLVVLGDGAVLQLDPRVRLDVVVPDRVLRAPRPATPRPRTRRRARPASAGSCGSCRSWRRWWSAG